MAAFKTILSFTCLLLWGTVPAQKVFWLEYKYTQTKYMGSRGTSDAHASFSNQVLAGATKEVTNGLRLGFKAGASIDKVYSDLATRNPMNYSRNNIVGYVGVNVQKCLLSGWQRHISLWASVDVAAEPIISRKSVFTRYIPRDSFPENTLINYNAAYIDRRTRFCVTPLLKAEIWFTKRLGVFAQAGYAVELGKSNLTRGYFTNFYTLENFPEAVPPAERVKENYLFAGGGIGYAL